LLLALALAATAPARAPDLKDFEAALAANDSATAALRDWCAARGIADPAVITAERLKDRTTPPPARLQRLLRLTKLDNDRKAIGYRHVRLSCGGTVLSEAHNWYVRSRLTEAMNRQLDETNTPFGKAVAALNFRREPLLTQAGCAGTCPAGTISTHRALLRLPDGRPLALVIEYYTPANLGR